MKIIIVGAGVVGFDVAKLLSNADHDVIVMDMDGDALVSVRDKLDVMTLQGNGTSSTALQEAGVDGADILIAVTAIDEVNIVACMLADRLGVKTTVARVRSGELSRTQSVLKSSDFGIDLVIHPEESAASEVARLIRRASATDVLSMADGKLQLVGLRLDPDASVLDIPLRDVARSRSELKFRVVALVRGIRTLLPTGAEKLRKGDQVFVMGRPQDIPDVLRLLGKSDRKISNVMILGGNAVGAKVALELSRDKDMHVRVVEPDLERATELADVLDRCLVIRGEATDIDLLVTEGLPNMDAFVAVTDNEESNLVTCLLAKHLGVYKTVALLSQGAYIPISQSIGLDAAVNKKMAVSSEIMRFLHATHVHSVATVHGLDAEILEIEAGNGAPITKKTLSKISMPRGILIGAILKGDSVEVATGHTQVNAGDKAYVFALPRAIHDIEAMFKEG